MSIRLLETAKPTMILDLTTTTTTKKTRLVASGVINVKKSHLKGVHYHVMHPSYPRPSVKSFIITVKRKWNSACQYRENYATIVFQPTVNALIFLWMVFLCRIFFLTHMHLQDIFFSKSPSPNPFSKPLSICITSKNQFYQQDMIESSHSHSKELLSLIFSKHFIKNTTQPTEATLREWKWELEQRCFWAPDGKWKWCCPIFRANSLH